MSCPNPLLVSLYGSPNVAFLAEDELELQIPPTIPRNGLFAFLKEQLRDLSNVLLGFLLTTTNLCNHANNTCLVNSSYRSWRSTLLNVMWLYVIPGILSAVPLSKECFGLICLGYTLYTAARSTIAFRIWLGQDGTGTGVQRPTVVPLRITQETSVEHLVTYFTEKGAHNYTQELQTANSANIEALVRTIHSDIYVLPLQDNTLVAVKCVVDGCKRKQLKRSAREFCHWSSQVHENVLSPLGFAVFRGRFAMVSLWAMHGSVVKYVNSNPGVNRNAFCTQLASAIAFLHDQPVVHGDIKGDNVLIYDEGVVKVADFGVSIMEQKEIEFSMSQSGRGTTRYQAPEILSGDTDSTMAGDVYAVGMTMLEIITGERPYGDMFLGPPQLMAIMRGELRPACPHHIFRSCPYGDQVWKLLTKAWTNEPSERPSALQVYEMMEALTREPTGI